MQNLNTRQHTGKKTARQRRISTWFRSNSPLFGGIAFIALSLGAICYVGHRSEEENEKNRATIEFANNPIAFKEVNADESRGWEHYARKLRNKYSPCLNHISDRKLGDLIRAEWNDDKFLIRGAKVKIPIYECDQE